MSEKDKNRILELEAKILELEGQLSGSVEDLTPSEAAKVLRKVNTDNNVRTQPKVKLKEKKK
jgi:hypothetical protein